MHFIAAAELDLSTLVATGGDPLEGLALVYTPETTAAMLASLEEPWPEHLPSNELWEREAPQAAWYAIFAPAGARRIAAPPPDETASALLVIEGRQYPGTVVNDADGEEARQYERFLIAGSGEVPQPSAGQPTLAREQPCVPRTRRERTAAAFCYRPWNSGWRFSMKAVRPSA